MSKECAVKGLTKRGQIIADQGKNRQTVKNYTNRLYILKRNGEPVGCEIVSTPTKFPPKEYFLILPL